MRKLFKMRGQCGFVVDVPCNWNIEGRCGVDTRFCRLQKIASDGGRQ